MAMDVKMDFLRCTEKALEDKVTIVDMAKIMTAISDVMEHYDIRKHETFENEIDDCLECYVSALSVQNRSQKTIDRYVYIIKRMMKSVGVATRRITVYHLRNYIASEKARGICDETLEGYRSVFTAYFNWLQRESLIEKNPTANLGVIKRAKKEKKTYTEIEIEKLNHHCKCIRDRAIINFLASTGCRVSEMTGLNRESVDMQTLECVVHGKGNKERTVYLSPVAGMLLAQYLGTRTDDNPALFIGQRGERLLPGGVRAMLKVLAFEAEVEHVHPHKFRRTLATDLSRHGMPIQEVASILGHDRIDTTMRYVVLNKDDIKNAYRRFA